MRLSEAIALGRTLVVMDPHCWQKCLIGLGYHGIGKDPFMAWAHNWPEYPWLSTVNPATGQTFKTDISNLAVRVKDGEVTMEQAIDWVRSVEPPELEETANGDRNEAIAATQTELCIKENLR